MTPAWIVLDQAAAPASSGSPMGFFVPMILIFVIMYFFLIRPQSKKMKEQQKMIESVTPGTEVVLSGGIHGIVKGVKGQNNEILIVQIAEGIKVDVDRSAIARVKGAEIK